MNRRLRFLVAVVLALGAAVPVAAHDPDPSLGDLFAQGKVLQYRWSASGTPPYDMKIAIHDARDDANASREFQLAPSGVRGELLAAFAGRTVAVVVNGRTRRRGGTEDAGRDGVQSVTAPMPGRVVRILVSPGDTVAARQGVVVVEAMKMENELRSPKAGTVREVSVTTGTSVEAGRVLVVIE